MEDQNKKIKLDFEELLIRFRAEKPDSTYRFTNGEFIQRKSGKKWVRICQHNHVLSTCKPCGGKSICQHNIHRDQCKKCNGCEHDRLKRDCVKCKGQNICEHAKRRTLCIECNGSSLCEHQRRKTTCVECKGSSICEHLVRKSTCIKCKGSGICLHGNVRTICKECGGGSLCIHNQRHYICIECKGGAVCDHLKIKSRCALCGGSEICKKCNIRRKYVDDYCKRCHPDYVETGAGSSKIACKYIDAMEELLKCKIEHYHYDLESKEIIGSEHRPPEWHKKPIDGYIEEDKIAVEFFGNYYHGHPDHWKDDENATNHFGKVFKSLFYDTERKMQKLKDLGYIVYYAWESDFRRFKDVEFITYIFEDKLEWRSKE